MMLVQKPPSFRLNDSPVRHRRFPSEVVQPTNIPGLLTLSKPLPKPSRTTRQTRTKPVTTTTTPSPTRPTHAPRSIPSQAEGTSDPFIVSTSKPRNNRKRQPIPIPAPSAPSQLQPARSVPLPHHRPAKRSAAPRPLLPAFDFPVCDDMSDNDDAPAPVTPTRPHRPAPKQPQSQPQPQSAFVSPARRPRNHKRAPSDSGMVFNMSSDESGAETASDEINALFRRMAIARKGMRTPPPAQREQMYEAMAQKEVQGYFASSSFQNSPSPEELPDPEFV